MPRKKEKAADGSYDKETQAAVYKRHESDRPLEALEGGSVLSTGRSGAGLETMVQLGRSRSDGYIRIVFDSSLTAWWKWRFTSGRWEGHYVLVSQSVEQGSSDAFLSLAQKLGLVDAGLLKPSWDKGQRG